MMTLLKRIEELERNNNLLLMFVNTQSQINERLVRLVNDLLSKQDEEGTDQRSGLILPGRLNS